MKKKKPNIWCLLFLVLLLGGSLILSAGRTFAGYSNTRVLNTVLPLESGAVTSDCLISDGQQTILLGTLAADAPTEVSFTLSSVKAVSARLDWSVDQPDYLKADIRVEMLAGEGSLSADRILKMGENAEASVTLVLTPQPNDQRGEEQVNVEVSLGDTLKGTFRGILPAPEKTDEPTEPETEPTSSPEDVTEPATEPTSPTGDTTEPTAEPTSPTGDETEPATEPASATQPTEAPTTEPTGSTEATPEPATEPTGAPAETQPSEEPPKGEPSEDSAYFGDTQMKALSVFDPAGALPVKITPTVAADRVVLGMGGGAEASGDISGFPARTRYSLDGGESYDLLYYGGVIELPADSGAELPLLLDFSGCSLSEGQTLTLIGEEYARAKLSGRFGLDTQTADASLTEGTLPEAVFLTSEKPSVTLALPVGGDDWTAEITVEMLRADENGVVSYEQLPSDSTSLQAEFTRNAQAHTLKLWLGAERPAAGTYRVRIEWMFEGICYKMMQTTLFIIYA